MHNKRPNTTSGYTQRNEENIIEPWWFINNICLVHLFDLDTSNYLTKNNLSSYANLIYLHAAYLVTDDHFPRKAFSFAVSSGTALNRSAYKP
jgi:hypothetical protein